MKKILNTDNSKTTILIRLIIGTVFLSEGIQKFIFPESLGTGRFEKIGLPMPDLLAPFVGSLEVVCGVLILLGLFTRAASVVTTIIMIAAIVLTKTQVLTGKGFWQMLHESRTDWAMLLGSLFLVIKGAGLWSIDNKIIRNGI